MSNGSTPEKVTPLLRISSPSVYMRLWEKYCETGKQLLWESILEKSTMKIIIEYFH